MDKLTGYGSDKCYGERQTDGGIAVMGGWVAVVVAGELVLRRSIKKVTVEQRVVWAPKAVRGTDGTCWSCLRNLQEAMCPEQNQGPCGRK